MKDKCPCEECLLISRCKHKYYFELLGDCTLVEKYLYISAGNRRTYFNIYMKEVDRVMKSHKWRIVYSDTLRITIREEKR